jgi:hypothetical protein
MVEHTSVTMRDAGSVGQTVVKTTVVTTEVTTAVMSLAEPELEGRLPSCPT